MLANRFGQFDPSGRTFRITDPGTPMPWVNVISNGRYGLVISQNGGGFSFYDDAQHNVLTRWEMDLVRDCSGKFIYLSDRETGDVWSVAPAPCGTRHDAYECAHTIGATTFKTAAHGISAEWTLAVAEGDGVEVWTLELKNTGTRARGLRVSSFFEWCCGVAPDVKREFHRLFFTTRHDPQRRAIIATKNMWDIPRKSEREHWNVAWPYVAAHAVTVEDGRFERDLAIADKQTFVGKYGSFASPAAMRGAIPGDGRFGRFGDAAGALGGDFTLAPGATLKVRFLLAVSASESETLALIDKYSARGAASAAVAASLKAWSDRLAPTNVESERPDFDLLNNDWLPYQALSGRLFGRTGYYQQSGAFGFRDQLQDSQVWLPIDPAGTARQIMLHAERQFADGSVYHWWHALANFGNHTACSDDYLWLPFVVANYVRETEDYAILDRRAPFVDDPAGGTIKEHCTRSLARAFRRTSERGIPFIGSCDWNDGLSAMGVAERGESVWLAMFLAHILTEWGAVLKRTGDSEGASDCSARREQYERAVNNVAWDGAWYRYGTKDSGAWVGASACAEGKIHLNAQTWSIISGIAPRDRAAQAWKSVKEHLLSPYGPLLLAPAYTTPDVDLGYITRYSPGSRENGGVYMHAATWALMAACMMREVGTVQKVWDSIAPPTRGQDAERYWAEPYVTPGNVDGPLSDLPGRAGWTWYTGSAAWLNRVALEWVLGVRPAWTADGAGLCVDPCPPESLGKVSFTRTWRGVRVRVNFDAREMASAGSGARAVLSVNGREIEGNVIGTSWLTAEAKRSGLTVAVRFEPAAAARMTEPKMGGAAAPSSVVGPRRSVQ